jgi:hypothetical protein
LPDFKSRNQLIYRRVGEPLRTEKEKCHAGTT